MLKRPQRPIARVVPDPVARAAAAVFEPATAQLAQRELRWFVQLAWRVSEPRTPFVSGWHLDAVCDHLSAVSRGQIRNLLINIPPRHMKSLAVGVFWPAWEWILAPQRRWLFASYALSLSERDSVRCRRLIESPWYQHLWGDRYALCGDQNTKLRYDNTHGGQRIATSVGGAVTGEGGDRLVVDDPHNVIDRESESARNAALQWWDQSMSTRLNDPATGAKVIVMQRLHEKDLSGHVLEQGGFTHLCLPAEYEPSRKCVTSLDFSDPRSEEGQLLWPRRIGPKEIAEFKTRLGADAYAGQFQQRPSPAGGGRFKADWFAYYTRDRDGYELHRRGAPPRRLAVNDCQRFAVMDPAGTEPGENRRPCYTVIQVWDVGGEGDMLLVHQYRAQVQTPDVVIAAQRICAQYDAPYIVIEKDGIGLGIVQHLKKEGLAVRAIKARGPKFARSQIAEIRMAAGQIFFPRGGLCCYALEAELLQFPHGQFCDQVDALAHAAIEARRIAGGESESSPPGSRAVSDDDEG